MLNCREVVDSADHFIDGDMNWRQRLAMKMHLLMCHHCRRYVRQLRALLKAIPFMHRQASNDEVSKVMEHINKDHS
ncbi:MAG: zf-HC2 domain-containing protein [Chromatocurvus sp.]